MKAYEGREWEQVLVDHGQGCSIVWVVLSGTGSAARAGPWSVPTGSVRTVDTVGRGRVIDEVLVVDPTLPSGSAWAGCADVLVRAAAEAASTSDAWAARMLETYPGAGLAGTLSPRGGVRGLVRGGQVLRVLGRDAARTESSWQRGVGALVAFYARWCVEPLVVGEAFMPGVVMFSRSVKGEPGETETGGEAMLWSAVIPTVG